jgi:hypothetical protein
MATYKKRIEWLEKAGYLSEAVTGGPEFALVSEGNAQCCQFVHCKDFIQDAIWGTVNQQSFTIYGFGYSTSDKHQPCLDRAKLIVTNSGDPRFRSKIPGCMDFLHQFEDKLGIPHSKFREGANPRGKYQRPGIWCVEGHRRWILSPAMLSMYTLLIRAGFAHKVGDKALDSAKEMIAGKIATPQSQDKARLQQAWDGIQKVLDKGDENIFGWDIKKNYPKEAGYSATHQSLGIVGYTSGAAKGYCTHWK